MQFKVLMVDDDDLPAGVEHLIVERDEGLPLLIVTQGDTANWWSLVRACADVREAERVLSLTG